MASYCYRIPSSTSVWASCWRAAQLACSAELQQICPADLRAEQARQHEAQTLVLEGIRQQQEAMRLQLQQQSQILQQMFTFFSGCFNQLYCHTGLPKP